MRRCPKFANAVALIVCFAFLFSVNPASLEAQAKKNVVITSYQTSPIMEMAFFTSVPMFMKYYEAEGLNVSFHGTPGGTDAIQVVVSGGAQFVYVASYPAIAARSRGVPLRSFMRTTREPISYPAVLDGSQIREVKEFKGKVVGVNSMGSGMVPLLNAMLVEAGLNPKDIEWVIAGVGSQALAAMQSGRVQVLALWDGAYWEIEALGAHRFRKIASPLAESLSWTLGMYGLESYMKEHPQVVAGLGRAISKATVFAEMNPEAVVRIHWKVFPQSKPTGIDEATALKRQTEIVRRRIASMKVDAANMREFGATEPKEARAMYEFLVKGKVVAKEFDPNEVFTNEYIARINDYDVRAVQQDARNAKP